MGPILFISMDIDYDNILSLDKIFLWNFVSVFMWKKSNTI